MARRGHKAAHPPAVFVAAEPPRVTGEAAAQELVEMVRSSDGLRARVTLANAGRLLEYGWKIEAAR